MATSGTVSTTVFTTQKVIDHAFRRCRLTPQQVTSEHIQTALDLLFLLLSTLVSKGIKLWNIEKIILPLYEEEYSVVTPLGVVDMFNCNLRVSQRVTGTATSTEGLADNAFDGDVFTTCTQTLAAGSITMQLPSAIAVPQFGILPNVSGSWDFSFQYSEDSITWVNIFTRTAVAAVAGNWLWYDAEGVTSHLYYRLQANGTTILDVAELVYQNLPSEVPLAKLNRDDYANLPNKTFTGRPTQFWWDKQRSQSVITLWPSVSYQFTFAQLVCFVQTYIEDVGTMSQEIEVPQRWYLAIVTGLAAQLAREIKEVDPSMIPIVAVDAASELSIAWDGESDGSVAKLMPNISPYTR
jgi:hypothetical protein